MFITVIQIDEDPVSFYTETETEKQNVESMLRELGESYVTASFVHIEKISNLTSLVVHSIKKAKKHIRHTFINK